MQPRPRRNRRRARTPPVAPRRDAPAACSASTRARAAAYRIVTRRAAWVWIWSDALRDDSSGSTRALARIGRLRACDRTASDARANSCSRCCRGISGRDHTARARPSSASDLRTSVEKPKSENRAPGLRAVLSATALIAALDEHVGHGLGEHLAARNRQQMLLALGASRSRPASCRRAARNAAEPVPRPRSPRRAPARG